MKGLLSLKIKSNFESHPNMAILGDQGCEHAEVQIFLIRKNKMDEYLLHEATNRHIALTKTL